jgi:hypothetical protein
MDLRALKQDLRFRLMNLFPKKGWRFFNDPDFHSDHHPEGEPVDYDPHFGEICTLVVAPEKEFRIYLRCGRPGFLRLAMEIDKTLLESAGVLLVEDENHVFVNLNVHGKHLKIRVATYVGDYVLDTDERDDCIIQHEQILELGSEVHEVVELLVGMVYAIVDKNNAVEFNTLAGQQLHRLRREQNAFTTTALDPLHRLQQLRNRHSSRRVEGYEMCPPGTPPLGFRGLIWVHLKI